MSICTPFPYRNTYSNQWVFLYYVMRGFYKLKKIFSLDNDFWLNIVISLGVLIFLVFISCLDYKNANMGLMQYEPNVEVVSVFAIADVPKSTEDKNTFLALSKLYDGNMEVKQFKYNNQTFYVKTNKNFSDYLFLEQIPIYTKVTNNVEDKEIQYSNFDVTSKLFAKYEIYEESYLIDIITKEKSNENVKLGLTCLGYALFQPISKTLIIQILICTCIGNIAINGLCLGVRKLRNRKKENNET